MDAVLVTYDITDDKRRSKIADVLGSYGRRIQYSVFWCCLSPRQHASLLSSLDDLVVPVEDQVLLIRLGPLDGVVARSVTSVGRPFDRPDDGPVIT